MSLRRKSCETCFRGKRKCDLEYPTCKRCQRGGKECRYAYSPQAMNETSPAEYRIDDARDISAGEKLRPRFLKLDLPNFLGPLGEIRPIIGQSQSWGWFIQELKSYPTHFAQDLETTFISKELGSLTHGSLRTAFSICGAHAASLNKKCHGQLWQIIDVEVAQLLASSFNETLLQDLARLQALVLYQILRLLHGDFRERVAAERQGSIVAFLSVRLLSRAKLELGTLQSSWEGWVIAENIRRTVMVGYLLYGVYWLDFEGSCPFFDTLKELPVSSRPELWQSDGAAFLPHQDIAITYQDYAMAWAAAPRRKLNAFEKLILVPCKGLDKVEMYSADAD